ncbi:thioesterase II family protein [Micromonospora olivasterospora]|uniref:Pyochelin biosynthetic protein PchC n=1 Tax=Micromonospora olivasterospora TaxID=1880 RepID=A0A562IBL7_MICOL|nr:alpha/beta fold hydrolase [Micromonospora olivasterospora]TWH68024.1 pyochelin biosynthetic protein PchC [Micromonospora olivasterospora]
MSLDLIVFPGAGSFGGELRAVVREFQPSAWLAHYPGRFGRDFGKPAESFTAVVKYCVAQIVRRKPNRPVLVGHSFGAYVAYAVAARLEEVGTGVVSLVVVGATAPSLLAVPETVTRSRSDLAVYLADLAPDADVSDDWRDATLDLAMQDLRLLREFVPSTYPRLRSPIRAARGDGDQLATTDGIRAWRPTTSGEFTYRVFVGGHSHVLHGSEFISWLREIGSGVEVARE